MNLKTALIFGFSGSALIAGTAASISISTISFFSSNKWTRYYSNIETLEKVIKEAKDESRETTPEIIEKLRKFFKDNMEIKNRQLLYKFSEEFPKEEYWVFNEIFERLPRRI